jgi:hypothetical protein
VQKWSSPRCFLAEAHLPRHPVLDHHRDHFGKDFAQHACGTFASPLINMADVFPGLDEDFNVPASLLQHQDVTHRQQIGWGIGDEHGPMGQGDLSRRRHGAMFMPLPFHAFNPRLSHLLTHPYHDQANRQTHLGFQPDLAVCGFIDLAGSQVQEIETMPLGVKDEYIGLQTLEKEAPMGRFLFESL